MTGFRLSWFLQDKDKIRLTEIKPDVPHNWKPSDIEGPRTRNLYLDRVVQLVSVARMKNMNRETVIRETIRIKTELILSGFIEYTTMCSNGRVKSYYHSTLFDKIRLCLNMDDIETIITDEDIKTDLMIYSAIIYCSEPVAISQFLHGLLSSQSPRTIIQATVNTIQSENIKKNYARRLLNEFYLSLNRTFNFQYGKILLAISSDSQIEAMKNKGWPFFTDFSQSIEQCLRNASCQGVNNLLQGLGKLIVILFYFKSNYDCKGSVGEAQEVSLHPAHMISSNQDLTPTSLIPFCAYQTEVALVGQERADLPFPVCSKFQPTVLEGQLCYSINISSIAKDKTRTKKGLKNGLILVLSPGSQEVTQDQNTGNTRRDKIKYFNFEPKSELSSSASIYISTLASLQTSELAALQCLS